MNKVARFEQSVLLEENYRQLKKKTKAKFDIKPHPIKDDLISAFNDILESIRRKGNVMIPKDPQDAWEHNKWLRIDVRKGSNEKIILELQDNTRRIKQDGKSISNTFAILIIDTKTNNTNNTNNTSITLPGEKVAAQLVEGKQNTYRKEDE